MGASRGTRRGPPTIRRLIARARSIPTPPLYSQAETTSGLGANLHPIISDWFARTFEGFTQAQQLCIPAILARRSVLLSSPTGSGKTLAGFLGIIDWLLRQPVLPEGICAIYVSPLRALTYDIQKNLAGPLREMGLEDRIRVGLRTGDTSARERAQLKRRPPQILLTTPESLAILLCQPGYHPALGACRFVIVDELHALAENKRGAHLSISLERLERLRASGAPAAAPLCRIGLSATISPMETMAAFLAGAGRPCVLAEARTERRAVIEVFSPVRRNPYPPAGYNAGRVLQELAALIRSRQSVLVFTNTRSGAENMGVSLKRALPELAGVIEVHHSSLDRNLRLDVEDRLKNGALRAVVCSTSLEMGVDIGAIDLVVMISAPKGISRALQRIGRSGHSIKQVSHGILVATNVVDLLECAVTARLARERRLDPVRVQENPADVLAQHLVGCAMAEPGIAVEEAWALVRGAWPFRDLPRAWFDRVLEYLEGGGRSLAQAYAGTFGKIRVDGGRLLTVSPRVERESLVNMGTIATVGQVDVVLKRRRLGTVEEYFVKQLKPGDVFVIGGRTVRLLDAGGFSARVEAADGERPNVPTWGTAGLALTSGLAGEIARVRQNVAALLANAGPPTALDWLVENWDLSVANAQAVVAQFELQRRHSVVPHHELMLIEQYREPGQTGRSHYFFHSLIGRPANDALSRIVARRVAALAGGNALVSTDDYGFLLTLQRFQELTLEQWRACCDPARAEDDLRLALKESELVRWQFRGVAQTGLMVPRQFPGQQRAVRQLRFSAEILFRVLEEHEPDHPMLEEAYRQSIDHFLNLRGARAWMEKIARPDWPWRLIETDKVSPFAFGLFASRFREGMMFEDPAEAIERMYHHFYGAEAL
jgi:ATP-dependent Lhr-like helicase